MAATIGIASPVEPDPLLKRFAAGDAEAFESLFRQYQTAVYGWIVRIIRDRVAAEDLTVEAFWRIYNARARFDPAGNFAAWARRIATNLAIDHLKSASRRVVVGPRPSAAAEGGGPTAGFDAREKIVAAFESLPPKLRAAATLALVEEQPYSEIASALGISVAAVKSRVFRATRRLRKKLERMGIDR